MEAEAKHNPETKPPVRRVNGRMWQAGESGNPHGRPVGARGRFSERFVADLATAWGATWRGGACADGRGIS
jgi:hypothetical protein